MDFMAAINWSTLSSIGNSKIARLTILMPIIGYLLIFNSQILGFLEVSLPGENELVPNNWLAYAYSKNMKFLYFGLLVFGLGVALYNVFAPIQVKKHPSVEDYISAMEKIRTRNLVIGSFDKIIEVYQKNYAPRRKTYRDFAIGRTGFPAAIGADLNRLIKRMFSEIAPAQWSGSEDLARMHGDFYTGSGYLKTEEVIEIMYNGRRVDEILAQLMYETLDDKSKDVFYIEHNVLEHSRVFPRFITFFLYSFGLALMAIPTIVTSLIIIKGW